MFDFMLTPEGLAALLTLTAMEVVLGIDNIVFISVLVSRLPESQALRARQLGLLLALGFRVALLFAITWIIGLKEPVLPGYSFSWRDVILFVGGAFLIFKAVHELHSQVEEGDLEEARANPGSFFGAMVQIAIIDLVFSIDSIITAIGMVQDIAIMITAVVISMAVMYFASGPVSRFISDHPTTKTLALAFLILIGVALCAEASGAHLPRGYIYAAMAFAAGVEGVNLWIKAKQTKRRAARRQAMPQA